MKGSAFYLTRSSGEKGKDETTLCHLRSDFALLGAREAQIFLCPDNYLPQCHQTNLVKYRSFYAFYHHDVDFEEVF